ncbi:hypothetical protein RFI_00236, partial [Reticulomyxa filosa]
MREINQINDGVAMTTVSSTETLKLVKKIYEKQEEYHQEEIMRLGTEITSKMERTLAIGAGGTDSPQSLPLNDGRKKK